MLPAGTTRLTALLAAGALTLLLSIELPPEQQTRSGGQGADAEDVGHFESTTLANGDLALRFTFLNFSEDQISVAFTLSRADLDQSMTEYGFSQTELGELLNQCNIDKCSQAEYDRKVDNFYTSRGMTLTQVPGENPRLSVDVPQVVKRNRPRLHAMAQALEEAGTARKFTSDQTFEAAASLVQTALNYRRPPSRDEGKEILGFYPPPKALALGWGDCDTKSALLAALLKNWTGIRMIGVHIPRHYLMGVARVPRAGDAYVEYGGEPFVLVEPAGPAWMPPGMIGDSTQLALNTMEGVRFDELY